MPPARVHLAQGYAFAAMTGTRVDGERSGTGYL